MPEGSEDAAILIAVSFQALNRALNANQDTLLADCTVVILFAGFYVEATLNHIFESIGKDIKAFPSNENTRNGKDKPGLQAKLAWFYNEFIEEEPKAANWKEIKEKEIYKKLKETFPGFSELLDFRNDLSHGKVNKTANCLKTAESLRDQAKELVINLYNIAEKKGKKVPRPVTFQDAIASLTNLRPNITFKSSSDICEKMPSTGST
jgi:hypothetical protein